MVPPHLHVRSRRGRLAALGFLMLLGACSGAPSGAQPDGTDAGADDVPVSFEPIVFPHAPGARRAELDTRDRRTVEGDLAGWAEKLALAQRYAAGGYDAQALQVLDGALAQDPPATWAGRMHALKAGLQARRVQEDLLRVDARPARDYVGFGDPVDFVVRLRNVSGGVLTFQAPDAGVEGTSPSAMMLEIRRRDRDVHATELRRTWNHTVFLQAPGDEPIRIPPGGVHDVPVRIPAEAVGDAIVGLRTLEVRGTLRPTDLRKDGEHLSMRLPIRPGRVMALPRNFEPLAAEPLDSMRTAAQTVAPAHLLIATEFVPGRRRPEAAAVLAGALAEGHPALYRAALGGLSLLRERAVGEPLAPLVRPLLEALDRAPGRADAIMEGLSTLTGVRLAPDPRLWRDWWRREGNRRAVVTADGHVDAP